MIESVIVTADHVGAKLRSKKKIMLSFDEWNVWYQSRFHDIPPLEDWPVAPRQLEDRYDVTDAVVVGSLLIALLRHSDRVDVGGAGAAGERDRADHDRARRACVAADDLPPVRPDLAVRARRRAAGRAGLAAVRDRPLRRRPGAGRRRDLGRGGARRDRPRRQPGPDRAARLGGGRPGAAGVGGAGGAHTRRRRPGPRTTRPSSPTAWCPGRTPRPGSRTGGCWWSCRRCRGASCGSAPA